MTTKSDYVQIALHAKTVSIAHSLAAIYALYESNELDIPEEIKCFEWNLLGILGEFALSTYLTGGIAAALISRHNGIANALQGKPFDYGHDLPALNVDCKTTRNRANHQLCGLHLLVHPRHVRNSRAYVLAVLDEPKDGDVGRIQPLSVQLVGWCYGRELEAAVNPNSFTGAHRLKAINLRPMSTLHVEDIRLRECA